MPWFASTLLGITRTTTVTCQRSQVGVLSRPSPECSNARPFGDIRRDELKHGTLAACIVPTGRTRGDPDHRVTGLSRRSGIALRRQRASRHRLAWGTPNVAVRAEYAAIAWLGPEYLMTSRALTEELARVRRHAHGLPMATERANEVRNRNRVHGVASQGRLGRPSPAGERIVAPNPVSRVKWAAIWAGVTFRRSNRTTPRLSSNVTVAL